LTLPEELEHIRNNILIRIQGSATSIQYRTRVLRKNGDIAEVEVFGVKTEFQNKPAIVGVLFELAPDGENKIQFQSIFSENPIPMFFYDRDTLRFIEVNQAAINHYGYTQEDFSQMRLLDILPKDEAEEFLKESQSLNSKTRLPSVQLHICKNGRQIEVNARKLQMKYKGLNSNLVIIEDVTSRNLQELERQRTIAYERAARETAEKLRRRSEFLPKPLRFSLDL